MPRDGLTSTVLPSKPFRCTIRLLRSVISSIERPKSLVEAIVTPLPGQPRPIVDSDAVGACGITFSRDEADGRRGRLGSYETFATIATSISLSGSAWLAASNARHLGSLGDRQHQRQSSPILAWVRSANAPHRIGLAFSDCPVEPGTAWEVAPSSDRRRLQSPL